MNYWLRLLGALVLLKVASYIMRDAEKIVQTNVESRKTSANGTVTEAVTVDG